MVLVDTSVWVNATSGKSGRETTDTQELPSHDEVATTGRFIAEVLPGATSDGDFERLSGALSPHRYFPPGRTAWPRAAEASFRLRRQGHEVKDKR
jgi:predicted nucleic acid-binding protein